MSNTNDSSEIRLIKLEINQDFEDIRALDLIGRVKILEEDKTEQIGILARLGQTVETLALTVATVSELTKQLDKRQEVFTAKFNIIIGILSTIGVALIAGMVKILFFPSL